MKGVQFSNVQPSQIDSGHSLGHLSVGHRVSEQDAGPNLAGDTEREEDIYTLNISLSKSCAIAPSPTPKEPQCRGSFR